MNGLSNPVVLVIDSNPLTMTATAATLHTRGHEVHCARDRNAALQAARDFPLDLILCDTDLNGEDGIDLVEELRHLPDRNDVPAMFVSATQLPDVILRSHKLGSCFHLRKPFDPNVLLELVDKALWMPHLVKSHVNRPHIPLGAFANPANFSNNATSFV